MCACVCPSSSEFELIVMCSISMGSTALSVDCMVTSSMNNSSALEVIFTVTSPSPSSEGDLKAFSRALNAALFSVGSWISVKYTSLGPQYMAARKQKIEGDKRKALTCENTVIRRQKTKTDS